MAFKLLRPILFFYLVLFSRFVYAETVLGSEGKEEEEFSEELLLRPLPDRKVLAHFHFESRAPPSTSNGRHHRLFPKAISQLVHKFRIKEMELSFTQGRWNYESWGGFDPIASNNAKPPGVELWAVFDAPQPEIEGLWRNLTHSLSGLFCASVNFLGSSTSHSVPKWGFRPTDGNLRYGSMPREAVCTENLTPWLKLIPCRDKAGISALMDRPSIYKGFYHSQRLRLTSNGFDSGILLEQTLTVVLKPNENRDLKTSLESKLQPSWSLTSLFGRAIHGRCVLAKSSNVYIQLDSNLVLQLKEREMLGFGGNGFRFSVEPNRVLEEVNGADQKNSPSIIYLFSDENYSESEPFNLGLTWNFPVVWSCREAPLRANRFLMGSGNERGAMAIAFESSRSSESDDDKFKDGRELQVKLFQVMPWYVKVYYHTLQLFIDEQRREVTDFAEDIRVLPSEDKVSPGSMELILKFPCGIKSAVLTLEFDKGFLHIDEYPPDANQGFDIPSAVISYPDFNASIKFTSDKSLLNLPVLAKFQENSTVRSYTEVLLVPLTTPDFSMPYNVITITCTVFALYFGSLLNVLRRRVAEEERFLKNRDANKVKPLYRLILKLRSKLTGRPLETPQTPSTTATTSSSFINSKLIFKVLLVAGIAIVWHFFFE